MSGIPARTMLQGCLLLVVAAACAGRGKSDDLAPERPTRPGAAGTVGADEIERTPGESIEKMLHGRIAGVAVSRTPDGGIAVRIRGTTSFYGSNEPLYVLDGIPINPGPNGSLTGINPHDIDSIKVLKDPAETALYGVRGANGVVLIKLKKPAKPDR